MADFYQRLGAKMAEERNARIFRDRPENLHDYQGCANDEKRAALYSHEAATAKDREEAKQYADSFIDLVNGDQHDTWTMGRDSGCRIRDHIKTLRHDLSALQQSHERLLKALNGVMDLIEQGKLVRDIRGDGQPDWALKQLPMVIALQNARAAIAEATPEAGTRTGQEPTPAPSPATAPESHPRGASR